MREYAQANERKHVVFGTCMSLAGMSTFRRLQLQRYTPHMKALWFVFATIALFAIGAYAVVSTGHLSRSVSSIIATSTIAEEAGTYKIQIDYPKFGNAKADAQVQQIIGKAVVEFKGYPPNPTPVAAKNEMIGEYSAAYVGSEVMSAQMILYQYTGGAHGGAVAFGLNFHPDGTAYTLDEALGLIGKNLAEVSVEANKQLAEDFGMVQFPDGATPTKENYATFLIGSSTVRFIFQQYQVEAYAAGMPEISFPRAK